MTGRSSEQTAFSIYSTLSVRDKRLVRAWLDSGGCDWATAILNSGVLARWRRWPDEAERDRASARVDELLAERALRLAAPDAVQRRREAAEHEAAHAVVAAKLGLPVHVVYASDDGEGTCHYGDGATPPAQRAVVAIAAEVWISEMRAAEFPRGAGGCWSDRKVALTATQTDGDLREATDQARVILRASASEVLALADQIETNGHVFLGP